jgi:hypothetical protein
MKRKQSGFNFRGFVALADMIFAVSAGLLLLNPIQFDSGTDTAPKPKPAPKPQAPAIILQMQQVEEHLGKLESGSPVIQRQAAEVIKNE